MKKGHFFIIPCTISDDTLGTLNQDTIDTIHSTKNYLVERARTARRFIKETKPPYEISELNIIEIETKDKIPFELKDICALLDEGKNVGLLSEAGCPGVADPGADIVKLLQEKNYVISPLIGPSSILLSLMASGMNGQEFYFHGYLPIKEPELKKKLKALEDQVSKNNSTQIFIETPYRNDRMLAMILKNISPHLRLCIASDITGLEESIKTKTIKQWKSGSFKIGKKPTVFLINR